MESDIPSTSPTPLKFNFKKCFLHLKAGQILAAGFWDRRWRCEAAIWGEFKAGGRLHASS